MEKLSIIFDCGATNVRVVAIDAKGEIKALKSFPNQTCEDPFYPGGRIWDLSEIWEKLCAASLEVISQIDKSNIVAVTTTTFGVDGTFIDKNSELLYPVISWQCIRTEPIMQNIGKYIPLAELYKISGVNAYSFNTINKLIWFKENRPDVIEKADSFLFLPSLINYLLTGEKCNDLSMIGTSMLTEICSFSLSDTIFNKIGLNPKTFGSIGLAGDIIGNISHEASGKTGIPEGTVVCLTGHDTQFAIYGSGADENQAVLSSGTWEILMARSAQFKTTEAQLKNGISTEFDATKGLYDIGLNWLSSGIVEWVKNRFYTECTSENCYDIMINEAMLINPGSNGVFINPDFNNSKNKSFKGQISGLTINTTRGEIMRATFEALSFQTKQSLNALENAGNFKAEKVICVGGGSKNKLWNQIRADVLNLPVITIEQKETTALGASFFAFSAAGVYSNPNEAKSNINYNPYIIYPSENTELYLKLYQQWDKLINQ